jgi:hypothetical protein
MNTAPAAPSGWYRIRVQGRLPSRWATRFEGMTLVDLDDGTTLIEGPVVDQAALHGLIRQVSDSGLSLISVQEVGSDRSRTTTHHQRSQS